MVDQIAVDFQRLSTTRDHIAQTVGTMNSTLDDLKAYIKPLTATWTGDASTQYQVLQDKWDASAADLNSVLGRISAALGEAITQLQAAERQNAARF
jgi:early secretory antigenic target protein ESAT-6